MYSNQAHRIATIAMARAPLQRPPLRWPSPNRALHTHITRHGANNDGGEQSPSNPDTPTHYKHHCTAKREHMFRVRHQLVDHIFVGDGDFEIVLVIAATAPRLAGGQCAWRTSSCMMFEDEVLQSLLCRKRSHSSRTRLICRLLRASP